MDFLAPARKWIVLERSMMKRTRTTWMIVMVVAGLVAVGGWIYGQWGIPSANRSVSTERHRSAPAKRVVSLAPSITEVLLTLDRGDWLVGVTRFSSYLEPVRDVEQVGGFTSTNYERIISLDPDLVLLKATREGKQKSALKEAGIETMTVRQESIDDILRAIRRIGGRLNRSERARAVIDRIEGRMREIRRKTGSRTSPSVMPVYYRNQGGDGITQVGVAGNRSFLGEIVEEAGGQNVYDGNMAYPKFSIEYVLREDPDYIVDFSGQYEGQTRSEREIRDQWHAFDELKATRRDRVHVISEPYALLPGPRFLEILERVARILHPDLQLEKRSWTLIDDGSP
jgi:iron complex transport system substrate-binding protein